MFINCPGCNALVATNLATGLPPERCPQCGFAPLAPAPAAESLPPQAARPVFVPLTPSRPAPAESDDGPHGEARQASAAAAEAAVPEPEPEPEPEFQPVPDPVSAPDPATPPAAAAPEPPEPAQPPEDTGATEPPAAPVRPAPRFLARRTGPGPAGGNRRLVAIAAGLAALLVIQLLVVDRDRLAAHAGWRPVVATLCGALRCSLPAWREPAAIAVEQRDVRPVPGRPGVLRASATIRNDGRWAQAWPQLVLTLSDVDGRALGMRRFEPAEYLTAPPQDVTIARGESAALLMDIVEPSPHAVAFNFSFE